jgi:hypothetical protein
MQKTSEVYDRLYHYTNSAGLVGILQTKTLWATHYKSLNDSSEIVFAKDLLISRMLPHVREEYEKLIRQSRDIEQRINQQGGLTQIIQHDTEVFVKAHYEATGKEIYLVSFCGQHKDPYVDSNGLLSQWRGYGEGGGFAVVFNTHKLEEMLRIEAERFAYAQMHLSDVVYSSDGDRLEQELSEDLSTIAHGIAALFRVVTGGRVREERETCLRESQEPFFRCITRLKHRGFSEENEVRLAALRTAWDQESLEQAKRDGITLRPEKEVKVRNKNAQLVPYIELFNSAKMDLPIERIIVGPHKEKEARAEALRATLSNPRIEVNHPRLKARALKGRRPFFRPSHV